MNKILIPTDFSEHSNYALEYACFIAKGLNYGLVITHVVLKSKNFERAEEKMKEMESSEFLKGVDYKTHLEPGKIVSKAINRVAVNNSAGLIVMGSKGISDVGEMLLGSNTENVIRNSKIDVLTVKQRMMNENLNTILFPSDFSKETFSVFSSVKKVSEVYNAKIHLLYVNRSDKEVDSDIVSANMDKLINHFNLPVGSYEKAIFTDKNEELGIINYAIDNELDLIAIGTHGKGILSKFINESTSQNLVRDTFRPILTMRFS